MTRLRLLTATGFLLLSAGACSDSRVTGADGGDAAAEVRVHGDAPADAQESRSASSTESSSTLDGSVEVEARVYLQTDTGGWVELTGGATAAQTVAASGDDGYRLLTRAEIGAESYQRVRIEFERVEGQLGGGLMLNLGGGTALVRVDVGSTGRITVEREVEIDARAGTLTRLDIDLNTAQWAAHATSAGMVAEGAFASAVAIRAR